jgi:hypothetical protein
VPSPKPPRHPHTPVRVDSTALSSPNYYIQQPQTNPFF